PLSTNFENGILKLELLKNIHIIELKGILSAKVIKAKNSGIKVILDIADPICNISMNILDICKIIGILLDNSIDAAIKCSSPYIKIAIINKKNSVLFVIINNHNETLPSIDKLFTEGFSTKGSNRGLGLSNLKETLNKYNNVLLDTSLEKNCFLQKLEIFYDVNIN
ncbi:MAG: sensor histidine kinase, partial [Sarcina sp.]